MQHATRDANTRVDALIARLADGILARPKTALALCLALTAACALGNSRFHHTMDYRFFFSEDNPQLAAFDALQAAYTKTDQVYIAIESLDGDVFRRDTLAAIAELTAAAWELPYAMRVDSLTNFQHVIARDDELVVEDLFTRAAELDDAELAARRAFALSEPFTRNTLVSPDGSVAGLLVTLDMPGVAHDVETPEVVLAARALVAELERTHPRLRTYLTGQVVVDQAFPESTNGDLAFVWPAFFLVMVVLLALIFRQAWAVTLTLAVGALAIAAGMGAAGWSGMRINAAVTIAPIMILTLAMADCIHLIASFHQLAAQGLDKRSAMRESLRINFWPVLLTSLMTAGGFLTLHFNDSPPYRALGYCVSSGVAFAWLFAVVILPCAVVVLPVEPRAPRAGSDHGWTAAIAELVIRRRGTIAATLGLGSLALCAAVATNRIDDDPVRYFGENQVMRQHLDFVNERIAGAGAIDFSIGAGDGEGIFEPGYMRNLDAFGAWLRTQPHVVHVDTVADIVKRLNKTWSGDAQAAYAVPEDRQIIAQLLLTYEFSLEPGLGTDNIITFDKDATRVRVQLDDTSGAAHIELDRRAQAWLVANAPPAMHAEGASAPLMFAHIGERSIRGILYGLVGSLLIMSLLLVALFRSVRLGVMSLVSNVLPVGMAFGAWGLMHGRVDVGLSVTLGIAFGIVVDDTIHFLTKYQRARAELGLEPEHAIRYAFRTVGRAIAITSIVLVAGFSMLGMSDMNITSNTSILTTITVAFAFSIDFFLVPSLLLLIDRPSPAIARAAAADAAAAQPA